MLYPQSVAVVGPREASPNPGILKMIAQGMTVYPVHPTRDRVHGLQAYPSLRAVPDKVDAVLSLTALARAGTIVDDCVTAEAGGLIFYASGSLEGSDLAAFKHAAAVGIPILGPNSNGFINARTGVYLSGAPSLDVPVGGIGFVTHSGGLHSAMANGVRARNVGMSLLISSGDELTVDMVHLIDFLVSDETTRVIALVVEQIRRPREFFAAALRARDRGKPIVALKLAKSKRAQAIARSHTGAIAGEPWVYEAAFRQHHVITARDFPDLLDITASFEQSSPTRWNPIDKVAIISTSGGIVQLASDMCADEAIELAVFEELRHPLADILERVGARPQDLTPNPLDTGGAIARQPELLKELLTLFSNAGADCLVFVWLLNEGAGALGASMLEVLEEFASERPIPVILCSVEDGELGAWTQMRKNVIIGRGLRGSMRALKAINDYSCRSNAVVIQDTATKEDRPTAVIVSSVGPILSFTATMSLLRRFGIPVCPYSLFKAGDNVDVDFLPFSPPFAVKLADVPHRTDIGGVCLNVGASSLVETIMGLRKLASNLSVPGDVIVQPMQTLDGEAFVGGDTQASLGPIIICGAGGTMVELLGKGAVRLAPFERQEAIRMVREINPAILAGFRGARRWDVEQLASIVISVSLLVDSCREWLASIDINPLAFTRNGFLAVDGLCVLRER